MESWGTHISLSSICKGWMGEQKTGQLRPRRRTKKKITGDDKRGEEDIHRRPTHTKVGWGVSTKQLVTGCKRGPEITWVIFPANETKLFLPYSKSTLQSKAGLFTGFSCVCSNWKEILILKNVFGGVTGRFLQFAKAIDSAQQASSITRGWSERGFVAPSVVVTYFVWK